MRVVLIVDELTLHSELRGEVWGEDIDAQGLQRAFARKRGITCCDILTMNLCLEFQRRGLPLDYEVAIHFVASPFLIQKAINVLFFQQFYWYTVRRFRTLLKRFDHVICPSMMIANRFREVTFFPLAVDPDAFRPVTTIDDEFMTEIIFIGNAYIRGIETYREFLSPATKYRLAIYGNRWQEDRYAEFRNWWRGVLPIANMSNAYSGARVGLSIHHASHRGVFQFVTARPYQMLSCGCPTIADSSAALEALLPSIDCGIQTVKDKLETE